MDITQSLERLKQLIFAVDDVAEQKRLIGSIIEEYKKESDRMTENANKIAKLEGDYAALKTEHTKLQAAQTAKTGQLAPEAVELLKSFFHYGDDVMENDLAAAHRMEKGMFSFCVNQLLSGRFIEQTRMGPIEFNITLKGQQFIMGNSLSSSPYVQVPRRHRGGGFGGIASFP